VRTEVPVHRDCSTGWPYRSWKNNWSVKQLHRWIVLSSTYRQSSDDRAKAAAVDPDNQLVHRFTRRRLEFEALRGHVTLPCRARWIPGRVVCRTDLTKEPFPRRRTIYGFIDRQNLPGMFRTFDFPIPM